MRIRTQNKTMLLEIDNFIINDKAEIIGYSVQDPTNSFFLGVYKTIDECIQVLDQIGKTFSYCERTDSYFNMPESMWDYTPLSKIGLPDLTYRKAHKMGYETIHDILVTPEKELHGNKSCTGLGKKSIKILYETIAKFKSDYEGGISENEINDL